MNVKIFKGGGGEYGQLLQELHLRIRYLKCYLCSTWVTSRQEGPLFLFTVRLAGSTHAQKKLSGTWSEVVLGLFTLVHFHFR